MPLILLAALAADPQAFTVGHKAPTVDALFAGGDALLDDAAKGKFMLMAWWPADDEAAKKHFAVMRKLRQEFVGEKRLQMMSVRIGGEWEEWMAFLDKQPPLDPKYPKQPFYSDFKWWQAYHAPGVPKSRNPFRVGKKPASFLIGLDGKFAAVDIPDDKLMKTVKDALAKK